MDYGVFARELQEILNHKDSRFEQKPVIYILNPADFKEALAWQWGHLREMHLGIYLEEKS